MTLPRLPYPWKILVAAAAVALLIMGVREGRKLWSQRQEIAIPSEPSLEEYATADYAAILARVQEIIAVHTSSSPEVATPTMPLTDLGFDSITRLEVADALETAFRLEIPSEELAEAATVEDLVQLVMKKQQEKTFP